VTIVDLGRPNVRVAHGTVERFAVIAMAAAFATQPLLHPSGPGNSSPVDVFTLVSLLATGIWAASRQLRVRAPYVLGGGLMVFAGATAGAFGSLPGTALLAVIQDVILIAWCAAAVTVCAYTGRIVLLAKAWGYAAIVGAGLLVLGWLLHIPAITGVIAREGNRALFTFGDPNYAATYWVLSIFVLQSLGAPRPRALRWGAYGLLLWALLLTESNGGVVELAVGCVVLTLVRVGRRHGAPACVAVLLLVASSAVLVESFIPIGSVQTWARDSGQPLLVNSIGRSNDSTSQRGQLLSESLLLYRSDSLLGSGPASTKSLLSSRQYPYAKEAHDDYLAALVERGPVGLLGVLLLFTAAAWRAGQVLRVPPSREPSALPNPAALVAGLAAVAVAGTYYEVLHFRFVWGLLALVAALALPAEQLRRLRPAKAVGS
jgi:hypothetical protein